MLFNGLLPPEGEGVVLEVHVDLIRPSEGFKKFLQGFGFEDDPFSAFWPKEYTHHMTGRTRESIIGLQRKVHLIRTTANTIAKTAAEEAESLYIEIELVQEIARFAEWTSGQYRQFLRCLDGFSFELTGLNGSAGADIHVEFPAGSVWPKVREYLAKNQFYWVATPPTQYFQAEEIATLQTVSYHSAREVFRTICQSPPPCCTAIHLELKLDMIASHSHLQLPEPIAVQKR